MSKSIKNVQAYIDRYDKMTVKDCRWHEDFHLNYASSLKDKSDEERALIHNASQYAWEIKKVLITLDWYNKKEGVVQKWMSTDRQKDELLENTKTPKGIFCDACYSHMKFGEKYLWNIDTQDRVLFIYNCTEECGKRKAVYGDGEQYIPRPHLCVECKKEVEISKEKVADDEIKTTYICSGCGNEEVEVLDLSVSEKEEDTKYEYDRERFCLSGEKLYKAQESRQNMENLKTLMEKIEEKEEKKDLYAEVEKLNKLTVPKLKELVIGVLEKKRLPKYCF